MTKDELKEETKAIFFGGKMTGQSTVYKLTKKKKLLRPCCLLGHLLNNRGLLDEYPKVEKETLGSWDDIASSLLGLPKDLIRGITAANDIWGPEKREGRILKEIDDYYATE